MDKTIGCVPFKVSFTNTAVPNVQYVWDFGDGSPLFTGPNPGKHEYTKDGVHVLKVTATDAFGCISINTIATIRANPTPVAGFERKQTLPCGLPQKICFPTKDKGGTNYNWSFGNGQTATDGSPCITYQDSGLFVVRQVVGNDFGCFDTATLSFRTYYAPVAGFYANVRTGCEDLTVILRDTSKFTDYAILRYDGRRDTLRGQVTHTFTKPGNYTITLTTGNASGCTSEQSINKYIEVYETPVAGFRARELDDAWPYTFQFLDRSKFTVKPSYFWDFGSDDNGDGRVDSAFVANPKHHFRSIGIQGVTLWIANEFGCRDSAFMAFKTDSMGQLFVPNILDPSDPDQEKRVFLPKGYHLEEYYIAVYTRTGQLMWESTALEDGQPKESWDGTLRGEPMPAGVYVWTIHKAVFQKGFEWKGMLDEDKVRKKTNFLYLVR